MFLNPFLLWVLLAPIGVLIVGEIIRTRKRRIPRGVIESQAWITHLTMVSDLRMILMRGVTFERTILSFFIYLLNMKS
jgi:hypothetical protein